MNKAQGRHLQCDPADLPSLPSCQNKALHHSAEDLNHLCSLASSCYLDNCQQEWAFFILRMARSRPIMFLINNFTHFAAARGCQDANNIYRLLQGHSREADSCWLPWQRLTALETWDPYKSTCLLFSLRRNWGFWSWGMWCSATLRTEKARFSLLLQYSLAKTRDLNHSKITQWTYSASQI